MKKAYLALGSNLGDRAVHLQGALDALGATGGARVVAVSRVYETEPVGGPPQPDYLNAVVAIETTLDARALLGVAQAIESASGRERDDAQGMRWGPRTLDVDVLLVGDERVNDPDLIVPHPRLAERTFVLAPLSDLDPALANELSPEWHTRWCGVRQTDIQLSLPKDQ